jgi:uncharacterized protein
MNNPKFTISKDSANEFRFLLRAINGEPILRSSEGYKTKQGCLVGITSVKENSPIDDRYRRSTSGVQYYFTLHARNGEPLGISEMYTTAQSRDNGINAVKRDAPNAPIEELT